MLFRILISPIFMLILIQVCDNTKRIDNSVDEEDNDSALVQDFPDVDAGE